MSTPLTISPVQFEALATALSNGNTAQIIASSDGVVRIAEHVGNSWTSTDDLVIGFAMDNYSATAIATALEGLTLEAVSHCVEQGATLAEVVYA